MILKKCRKCGDFFISKLHSPQICCKKPACRKYYYKQLEKIKHTRCIPIHWFNVYDSRYPIETGYQRVCRQCGARLVTKKGKYSPHRRWCEKHKKMHKILDVYWNEVRDRYLWNRHRNDIVSHSDLGMGQILCESCGKYVQIKGDPCIEVHHIIPVHRLPLKMRWIMQIWNPDNLIALCHDCHQKQDHQLNATVFSDPKINKLTKYLHLNKKETIIE